VTVKNLGLNLSLINRQKRKYEIGVGHNWETLAKQAKKDFAEYKKNPVDRTIDKIGKYSV